MSDRGRVSLFSRASGGRSRSSLLHFLTVVAFLVSLLSPLATLQVSATSSTSTTKGVTADAQSNGSTPPLLQPYAVSIGGDVASFLGSPLQLQGGTNGIWSGSAQLQSGDYQFITTVSTTNGDIQLGPNGDENGSPGSVSVPDGSSGAYFEFNQNTGETSAVPVVVELQTDFGTFPMLQRNDGYQLYLSLPPGSYQVQTLYLGQPTGSTATLDVGNDGRARVRADGNGNITDTTSVDTANLVVAKSDDQGNPLTDACFAVVDGDDILSQSCDANDGSSDGNTTLLFPDGAPDGKVNLVETFTPDGQTASDNQTLRLDSGNNSAQAVVASASEPPVEGPSDNGEQQAVSSLAVFKTDDQGQGLTGACFSLAPTGDTQGDTLSACDSDDGDDSVTNFSNVPAGDYILSETTAPDGYTAGDPQNVTLTADQQGQIQVVDTAAAAQTGTLVARVFDTDGNPIPGQCFNLSDLGQQCDGDDDNADMTQPDVPVGDYTVELVVPDGYDAVGDTTQTVTVNAGDTAFADFTVQAQAPEPTETPVATEEPLPTETPEAAGTGTLVARVFDTDGNPIPGQCFNLSDLGQQCDGDDDNADMTQPDVPVGDYTVELVVPDGYDAVGDSTQTVTVNPGDTTFADFTVQSQATEPAATETPAAPPAQLTVFKVDDQGNPLAGACFSLFFQDGSSQDLCDSDDGTDDGQLVFSNLAGGDYTLRETQAPDGYQPSADLDFNLGEGQNGQITVTNTPAEGTGTGTLVALVVDQDGNQLPGQCFEVSTLGQQCDGDDADAAMTQPDLPVGDYTLQLVVPDGFDLVGDESQTATITNGETTTVQFEVQAQEAATEEPTATEEAVATEEATEVPPVVPPVGSEVPSGEGTGNLQIIATDSGFPIPGFCAEVAGPANNTYCDNDSNDADSAEGSILVQDVPAGDYSVGMPNPPAGYQAAGPVDVTVSDGDTGIAQLVAGETSGAGSEETGNLTIQKTDADGNPLAGACFQVGDSLQICDNGDGDNDPSDGTIAVSDLPAGDISVSETQAPDGYQLDDTAQTATIAADQAAALTFTDQLIPPATGTVRINKTDANGDRIGGACFTLTGPTNLGPICDDGDGDGSPTPGVILIENVEVGDYTLSETTPPQGYIAAADQQITVTDGEVTRPDVVDTLATGSLAVTKYDSADPSKLLAGACFAVTPDGESDALATVCDSDDGADDGVTNFADLAAGDYQVNETTAPAGYTASADAQTVTIEIDQQAALNFANSLQTGSVEIRKVDAETGELLGGACFTLGSDVQFCDNDATDQDPTDGVQLIGPAIPGTYSVVEVTAPEGYALSEPVSVDVAAGDPTSVEVQDSKATGSLQILKVDAADGETALAGACFSIDGGDAICDNGDGDTDPADGSVLIAGLALGDHSVAETQAPDGYDLAADPQTATITESETATLTFENTLTAPAVGSIQILKVDAADGQTALAGACFSVDGGEPVCDNSEGDTDTEDGSIVIPDLTVGDHSVAETQAPEGFDLAADAQTATVVADETATLTFADTATATGGEETGSIHIAKTDSESGDPLGGACFSIGGDSSIDVCDNSEPDSDPADGSILVSGVAPGTYTITETQVPEGYATPDGPVADGIEVAAGETTEVDVANTLAAVVEPPAPEPGSLVITKTDPDGNVLAGACFTLVGASNVGPVCDNGDGDTDPADGTIAIEDIPLGDYTLSETTAPEGFNAAADQPVTITEGDAVQVTVVDELQPAETGSVRITAVDGDGTAVGGGCYLIDNVEYCDNAPGVDMDNAPGVILAQGVTVHDTTVTESLTPTGFDPITDPQPVSVEANATADVTFTYNKSEVEPGSVTFQLQDEDGDGVPDACVTFSDDLTNPDAARTVCDGSEDDADSDPGQVTVDDLEPGVYKAWQSTDEAVSAAGFQAIAPEGGSQPETQQTFEVKSGTNTIIIIIIIELPDEGNLKIIKRSSETNALLSGACFQVVGEGNDISVCDDDGVDDDSTAGVVRLNSLPSGDYTISETSAPPGYETADDQNATINKGLTTTKTFKDDPVADPNGTLVVTKTDDADEPLPGACFALKQGNAVIAGPTCDNDDGANDGVITFADVPAGDYTLTETQLPSDDYEPALDQDVTIIKGGETDLTVVNVRKPGSIEITKVKAGTDDLLPGACFGLDAGEGIEYSLCDQDGADANATEGVIKFASVPAGGYALIETQPPAGFDPADDREITVEANQALKVTVENTPSTPPTDTGNLTVKKTDSNGNPLPGACFSLKQGNVTKVPERCDSADGTNDGTLTFTGVGVGTYIVHETRKPSASYETAADRNVTISKNQTTTVTVANKLKPGRILVVKTNQQGNYLLNACFTITPSDGHVVCTDGNGEALFGNLKPGTYKVTEVKAPNGYQPTAPVTNVVVQAGLTTKVPIVDKKATPPVDAGSVKLIKFFCPQTNEKIAYTIYDSSDPGAKKLASTANCKVGDAQFTISRTDKDEDPISVNTGPDGQAQLVLESGSYKLVETKSGATVEFTVYVGQQTTIVVINYEPQKPTPAAIKVFKYTCDSGYQGSYYIDFITNCGEYEDLTNGVTVKISGPINAQRVTGDSGKRGQSVFTQLPSGQYTLSELTPNSESTTVYTWCGLTPEGDEYAAYGSSIKFPLQQGQTMWCAFFNVPDDVTPDTGTIMVKKYVCEISGKLPTNFDWQSECDIYTKGAKFGLSTVNGETVTPKSSGVTGADGILRFENLTPGLFEVSEIGSDWCHAESDSVDAKGNVVVKAGKRSTVFIFNCVEISQPPNTGIGTTATTMVPSASAPTGWLPDQPVVADEPRAVLPGRGWLIPAA